MKKILVEVKEEITSKKGEKMDALFTYSPGEEKEYLIEVSKDSVTPEVISGVSNEVEEFTEGRIKASEVEREIFKKLGRNS